MLTVGDTLPNMVMEGLVKDQFKKVKLSSYKGKWLVMLFYPADFTYVCPTELEEAAEHYRDYRKLGAEVVSVSTDRVHVHKAWHDHSKAIAKVTYPMLSDPTAAVCREFGTYIEADGESRRATFIIDPDQKIVAIDMHDNSIGRSTAEILRKLAAAKWVYDHDGAVVCPASWKPGMKTLKPGVELVGKI